MTLVKFFGTSRNYFASASLLYCCIVYRRLWSAANGYIKLVLHTDQGVTLVSQSDPTSH